MIQPALSLFLQLSLAFAAGPTVPDDLIAALPPEVQTKLSYQVDYVESYEARIAEQRRAVLEARAEVERLEAQARRGEEGRAQVDAKAASIGRAQLERFEHERLLGELSKAEAELKRREARLAQVRERGEPDAAAREAIVEAKGAVRTLQREVRLRAAAVKTSERESARASKKERRELEASREAARAARLAKEAAESEVQVARAQIRLFEAEQILAAAELQLSRAEAVAAHGDPLDRRPYEAARDEAKASAEAVRAELERLHRRAGLKIRGR